MPNFQYRAINKDGTSVTGMMSASDVEALEQKLVEIGYMMLEADAKGATIAAQKEYRKKKIKRRDLINFCTQCAALLSAGVTLLETVKTLAGEGENPSLRAILGDVARNIEAGYTFYEALENHPKVFSHQIVAMMRAGEQSGSMPETFRELAKYLEWLDKLMGDVKQATIYPAMVILALVLFITILFTFVVPKFVEILVALKIPLPMPTRIVMGVSAAFVSYWWLMIGGAVLTPILVGILRRKWYPFAYWWDSMKLRLPVFGELNQMFTISRFAQNFATLFRSGIPIMQNLTLCEGLVGNKVMEKAISDARKEVEEGIMLSESFRKHNVFSTMALRMLSVGETTGDLGSALDNVAGYYNEEIPRRVKKIFGIVEPAVMLFLIVVVGFVALAIFLPILSLMSGVKKG